MVASHIYIFIFVYGMTMTGVDSHDADNRAYRVLFCLCPNLITVVDGKEVWIIATQKELGCRGVF